MNIKSCVLAYEIKKGMKSFGPIGLVKTSPNATELINKQIKSLSKDSWRQGILVYWLWIRKAIK